MTPQRTLPRDLTGMKFGRLTAIEFSHKNKYDIIYWKCICECGNTTLTTNANLFGGHSKSCGCLQRDRASQCNRKHGMSERDEHRGWKNRTYRIWVATRGRCNNPNTKEYKNYGGRGIQVCPEWDDFSVFLQDMGERPPGLSIDRIDNGGDYEKGNCRWADGRTQALNKRKNTHCRQGHLYTGEVNSCGARICKICIAVYQERRRYLRKQRKLEAMNATA